MKFLNLCLLLNLIFLFGIIKISECQFKESQNYSDYYKTIEDLFKSNQHQSAHRHIQQQLSFDQFSNILQNNEFDQQKLNIFLGDTILQYAKTHLYGYNQQNQINLQKAYFFFKLAADKFGNPQAQYYISFFAFFMLDGSFNIKYNLDNFHNITADNLDQNFDTALLINYVQQRFITQSHQYLYFSSIQDNIESTLALAYRYQYGVGVKKNCSSAALYYNEVCKKLFLVEQENIGYKPQFLVRKQLQFDKLVEDKGIYQLFSSDSEDDEQNDELVFTQMKAQNNKIEDILKLAYYHYYGIKGKTQDYEKSIEYFYMASQLGDISAKVSLGFMYLRGIGVEKDFKRAYQYMLEGVMRKDPRALNGLGYIYFHGLGVKKDLKQALEYFKSSANLGDIEGQYNYGALHLMSSSDGVIQQNYKTAHHFLTLAAHQSHAVSLYNLGLLHLDGTDIYYSCDLGVKLLRQASDRGHYYQKVQEAYQLVEKKQNKKKALILYMEAAFLGQAVSQKNAGMLVDKFDIFTEDDMNFSEIDKLLDEDPIFQTLKENKLIRKYIKKEGGLDIFESSAINFLYGDFTKILYKAKNPSQKIREFLQVWHDSNPVSPYNFNKHLALKLYKMNELEGDNFSILRLGDFYYYGTFVKQNYNKALKYYQQANKETLDKEVLSQAKFNLGFMYQFGLGGKIDLDKAEELYEEVLGLNEMSYLATTALLGVLRVQRPLYKNKNNLFNQILVNYNDGAYFQILNIMADQFNAFNQIFNFNIYNLIFSLLIFFLLLLFILRTRLKNIQSHLHQHTE